MSTPLSRSLSIRGICSASYEVDAISAAPNNSSGIRFSIQYFREAVKSTHSFDAGRIKISQIFSSKSRNASSYTKERWFLDIKTAGGA